MLHDLKLMILRVAPFGLYAAGLAALLIVDVVVASQFSKNDIALWAAIRSMVGMSGVLCLVGLEQMLMRSPGSSARILGVTAVQIPFLSILVGFVFWKLGFVGSWLIAIGIALGSSFSQILFQYYRSCQINFISQLSQQSWKILTLAVVIWAAFFGKKVDFDEIFAIVLLLSVVAPLLLLLKFSPSISYKQNPSEIVDIYKMGIRFMMMSLMLTLSIYAEQLVVNSLGSSDEAALYFTHAAFFLFPASALNGYLAFLIVPWIRENHDRLFVILFEKWLLISILAFGYSLLVGFVGSLAWALLEPKAGDLDPYLRMAFVFCVFVRTVYTLPSGYVGVFGMSREHDVLIVGQFFSLVLAVSCFLFLWQIVSLPLIYSVAVSSLLGWLLRTCLGLFFIRVIFRRKNA